MATWGAYFASIVKKNDSNANGAPQAQENTENSSPFMIKPYNAVLNNGPSQDSFGLKRSDTKMKKLYTSPVQSTTNVNEQHRRSNSNAARVAKMFGYATQAPTPTLSDVVTSAVQAVKAEAKTEGENPSPPIRVEVVAAQKAREESKVETKIQSPSRLSKSPTRVILSDRPGNLPEKENPKTQNRTAQQKTKAVTAAKPSISSLDEIMDLLENEAFTPIQPPNSPSTEKKKGPVRNSIGKKVKANKPSISSLDEMMILLEQGWDVGSSDLKDSDPRQNSSSPVKARMAEKDSRDVQGYTEKQDLQSLAKRISQFVSEPEEMWVTSPSVYRSDSFTSTKSFTLVEPRSVVDNPGFSQAQTQEGEESMEKPLSEYMKEVEEMRIEREQMELERQRIVEEQQVFEKEAEKFAEEEEQMRRFVEDLKREEERDFENQKRKRRIAEEKARKEEEERKRLQNLEDERLAIKAAERLNAENEKIEKERREREVRMYQERAERERLMYVEEEARLKAQRMEDERIAKEKEERLRQKEDEPKLEAQRIEEEEIGERQRRAEEKRAEQAWYEEEEARRIENEQIAREQRAAKEAERLKWEEEEAQRDFQRRENERIAQERRRVERQMVERKGYEEKQSTLEAQRREDERFERMRYEEEDSEPEVLTKEQELAKAEEKIRAAFAGLAQERDQLSRGIQPTLKSPKLQKGRPGVTAEGEKGVSRYNTVAGGARTRQEQPQGVSRVNTVGVRSKKSIGGGLPSGPRAGGFGLPGGPRAGLPSGPRPPGKV